MLTKVQKWGNSLALRIPKAIAKDSDLEEGSAVRMSVRKGKIIVDSQLTKEYKLQDLLRKVTKKNLHSEVDSGTPVGKELF